VFTTRFQAWVRRLAQRAAARLHRLPVTPNQLTVTGLLITAAAALLLVLDHPFYAGLTLLGAGAFDILDGALARASDRSYPYGAFLDSTTDRISEGLVMVALLLYFQRHGQPAGEVLAAGGLLGSLLVSYVRARAQSLGFECDGGLLARPERVLLIVTGLLLAPLQIGGLIAVAWILAVFTNLTALQRIWTVWMQARRQRIGAAAESRPPAPARPPEASPPPEEREVRSGPEPSTL